MNEQNPDLGKLISAHGISKIFTQRALIVAIVSFIFFILMLVAFSLRQNIGYFLLGTAFLIVEIFTMIGWFVKRKTALFIYERGFIYKDKSALWKDITDTNLKMDPRIQEKPSAFLISTKDGKKIFLNESIEGLESIIKTIKAEIAKMRE